MDLGSRWSCLKAQGRLEQLRDWGWREPWAQHRGGGDSVFLPSHRHQEGAGDCGRGLCPRSEGVSALTQPLFLSLLQAGSPRRRTEAASEYAGDSSDEEVGRLPQLRRAARGRGESGRCEGSRLWSGRAISGRGRTSAHVRHRSGRKRGGRDAVNPPGVSVGRPAGAGVPRAPWRLSSHSVGTDRLRQCWALVATDPSAEGSVAWRLRAGRGWPLGVPPLPSLVSLRCGLLGAPSQAPSPA